MTKKIHPSVLTQLSCQKWVSLEMYLQRQYIYFYSLLSFATWKEYVGIFFHFCTKSRKACSLPCKNEKLHNYSSFGKSRVWQSCTKKFEYLQKLHRLGILASIIKHSHHHPICTFEKVCTFGNSFSQMYCKYYMVDFSTVQNARSSREELQTFSPQGRISVRLLSMLVRKKVFFTDFKKPILLENFFTKITFQVHQQVLFELLFMRNF